MESNRDREDTLIAHDRCGWSGYDNRAESGWCFELSRQSTFSVPAGECYRDLGCLSGQERLASAACMLLPIPCTTKQDDCRGGRRCSPLREHHCFHPAPTQALPAGRLALVLGDAVTHNRPNPCRQARVCRPVYLLADDGHCTRFNWALRGCVPVFDEAEARVDVLRLERVGGVIIL